MTFLMAVDEGNFDLYRNEVLEIEGLSFPSPWSERMFLEEIRREASRLWVLVSGERVRGHICFWVVAGEIHLLNLAVHPRERGKGLGRLMLEAMLQEGRAQGAGRVWLEVRASNQAAHRLYERMGFKAVGRRKRYYRDTGEDALVLALDLESPPGGPGRE